MITAAAPSSVFIGTVIRTIGAFACLAATDVRADDAKPASPAADGHAAVAAEVDAKDAPAATAQLRADASPTHYQPLIDLPLYGFRLRAPAMVATRGEVVSGFAVDANGTQMQPAGIQLQARLGLSLDSRATLLPILLLVETEADARASPIAPSLAGVGLPYGEPAAFELRKLFARAALGTYVQLGLGATTSHWGMGLVANDGAHGWEPGSARFADPVGGDRVLRAALSTGPHKDAGSLLLFVAVDRVLGDDTTVVSGDVAYQGVAAAVLGYGAPASGGIYLVRRRQESALGAVDAWIGDATARATWKPFDSATVTVESEVAAVLGETTLAPTISFPRQDVLQLGAAARASMIIGSAGGVVDFLYASGDQNPDDGAQNAFRPDPNYEMGLLLYRHVVAGLSARIPVTAGDPNIVGHPAIGLDRAPSRGSATNTLAVFPRALWKPIADLEVFAGPLIAFAPAKSVDPLNTRLAGGAIRNAYNAAGGLHLGTELDAGVRYRILISTAELLLGVEAGALMPGDAYIAQNGSPLPMLYGGRAMVSGRL